MTIQELLKKETDRIYRENRSQDYIDGYSDGLELAKTLYKITEKTDDN